MSESELTFESGEKCCTKCKEIKPLEGFSFDRKAKDKKRSLCRKCQNKYSRIYRANNPEKIKKANGRWREENPEKSRKASAKWRKANPDKFRVWEKNNLEKHCEKNRLWRKNNPEKYRRSYLIMSKKAVVKRRSSPKGVLNHRISNGIREGLKGTKNRKKWQVLVGYTLDELKKNIEKQFLLGMTWDNMGDWHIDHKIPISAFNFTKPEDIDFKRCWDLRNLQPMWSKDNLSKNDKIEYPFQPALAMGF